MFDRMGLKDDQRLGGFLPCGFREILLILSLVFRMLDSESVVANSLST